MEKLTKTRTYRAETSYGVTSGKWYVNLNEIFHVAINLFPDTSTSP